ncbi:MAG: hypothetical protein J2P24_15305 [Streptosporangiales bacterium]|nr:hypothetical protein [Streptosporangiales bacterium]MBO0892303.1 hypothetical protein [Acidothermales bacterium]
MALLGAVDFVVTVRAQAEWLARQTPRDLTPGSSTDATVRGVVLSAIVLVVWTVFLVKAWQGRNWGRIAGTVVVVVSVVNVLRPFDVVHQTSLLPPWIVVAVLQIAAAAVVAEVLLWPDPARSWYTAMHAYRAAWGFYPRRRHPAG